MTNDNDRHYSSQPQQKCLFFSRQTAVNSINYSVQIHVEIKKDYIIQSFNLSTGMYKCSLHYSIRIITVYPFNHFNRHIQKILVSLSSFLAICSATKPNSVLGFFPFPTPLKGETEPKTDCIAGI